jgi:hypothetical protein
MRQSVEMKDKQENIDQISKNVFRVKNLYFFVLWFCILGETTAGMNDGQLKKTIWMSEQQQRIVGNVNER